MSGFDGVWEGTTGDFATDMPGLRPPASALFS